MQPSKEAYDRASTIFSPDGRLFQVEYAREAVKRGTTTVGLKYTDGVVLIVDKRISSSLIEPDSIEKIFQIDDNDRIGCATSGLIADARALVEKTRLDAQINEITYDEKIPIKTLVKQICDFKQAYTQYGGARPFGTYKANSEGKSRNDAMAYFEEKYKENMTLEEAIDMGIKAIHKGYKGKLNPDAIEIAVMQ